MSLFGITWFYIIKKKKNLKTPHTQKKKKKLLELGNEMSEVLKKKKEMSEVVGYTISIQESVEFLLTNNEISKMKI